MACRLCFIAHAMPSNLSHPRRSPALHVRTAQVHGRQLIIALGLEVVATTGERIGNPVTINESSSTARCCVFVFCCFCFVVVFCSFFGSLSLMIISPKPADTSAPAAAAAPAANTATSNTSNAPATTNNGGGGGGGSANMYRNMGRSPQASHRGGGGGGAQHGSVNVTPIRHLNPYQVCSAARG